MMARATYPDLADISDMFPMTGMSLEDMRRVLGDTVSEHTVNMLTIERSLIYFSSRGMKKHVQVLLVAWIHQTRIFNWSRILEKCLLFGDCNMVENVLEELLPIHGSLNCRDASGRYLAVQMATNSRLSACLPKLAQLGLDFNVQEPLTGKSGLLEAARCGNVVMMEEMLENGADPTLTRSKPPLNVLHLLAGGARPDLGEKEAKHLVDRLHQSGVAADAITNLVYVDVFGLQEMFTSDFIKGAGSYAALRKIRSRELEQHYMSSVGCTPLMIAAGMSNRSMIQALLGVGCSVNCTPVSTDDSDCVFPTTALHVCAMNSMHETWSCDGLHTLIRAGGCVNALDGWNHIPLCYAVMAGNVNASLLLLDANSQLGILGNLVAEHLMENALLDASLGLHRILVHAGFPTRVLFRLVQRLQVVHALYVDHISRGTRVASSLTDLSPDSRHLEQIYVGLTGTEWKWLEERVYNPIALGQTCRIAIRNCMSSGATFPAHIQQLPIPPRLKNFLMLRDDSDWNDNYQKLQLSSKCDEGDRV